MPSSRADYVVLEVINSLLPTAVDFNGALNALSEAKETFVARKLATLIQNFKYDGRSDQSNLEVVEKSVSDNIETLFDNPGIFSLLRRGESIELVAAELNMPKVQPEVLIDSLELNQALALAPEHPSGGIQQARRLTVEETQVAVKKIREATGLMAEACPFVHALFKGLTSELILSADIGRRNEVWGATSGLAIGRILIVNADRYESSEQLAADLIHETVHEMLDCCELESPLVENFAEAEIRNIRSPWTGNNINLHAYLHATAVWAVAAAFWCDIIALRPEGQSEEADQKMGSLSIPLEIVFGGRFIDASAGLLSNSARDFLNVVKKALS